jgi:hypothetical protein
VIGVAGRIEEVHAGTRGSGTAFADGVPGDSLRSVQSLRIGHGAQPWREQANTRAPQVDRKQQNPYLWGMTLQLSPEQEKRVAEALRSGFTAARMT